MTYEMNTIYLLPNGEEINVQAKAKDVDAYEVFDLELRFSDCNKNHIEDFPYNKEVFDDIEDYCHEIFYDMKYNPGVDEFNLV